MIYLIVSILLLFLLSLLPNLVRKYRLKRAANKITSSIEEAKESISKRYKI